MNQNQNNSKSNASQPKQLTPAEVQQLLQDLLHDLDAAGREMVMRRAAALGVEPAGVSWLLSQACLSAAVATYFNNGVPLAELLNQIQAAWRQHEIVQATAPNTGRA